MHSPAIPTDAPFLDSKYSWLRLFISVMISVVGSAGMWIVVVVIPSVQSEFGVDRSDATLPFTAVMVGFAIGNLVLGRLVDRFGIVVPMVMAAILLTLGFALTSQATNIWSFAVYQGVFIGIGSAAAFGPLIADISHWFEKRRGIAVAAAASGNYIAGAVWPFLLKDIIAADGWRDAYLIASLASLVIMLPMAFLLRRRIPAQTVDLGNTGSTHLSGLKFIQLSPRSLQILLGVAGVGCCVAMSMPQVHIVAYCADLGYGVAAGAGMLSIMLIGGIFSRLASGMLADYIGGIRTILLGSFLQCMALFLYIPFDGLMSLYVVSLIFGLSQGGLVPGYALVVREYLPAKEAGERVGLVIMLTVVGMALGGWISGWIYDLTGSYQAAFVNGIAWNMLNMLIMAFLLWRTKEPDAVPA
ncbi:MAG: MFS transporter [Sneathiella sp.]